MLFPLHPCLRFCSACLSSLTRSIKSFLASRIPTFSSSSVTVPASKLRCHVGFIRTGLFYPWRFAAPEEMSILFKTTLYSLLPCRDLMSLGVDFSQDLFFLKSKCNSKFAIGDLQGLPITLAKIETNYFSRIWRKKYSWRIRRIVFMRMFLFEGLGKVLRSLISAKKGEFSLSLARVAWTP